MVDLVSLAVAVIIPLATGSIAGAFTARSIPVWYRGLKKPGWNPPDKLFAPVWTALYILMGTASYLVYTSSADPAITQLALVLYGVQLVLNFAWSIIFFSQHRIRAALAEIVLLWILILATTVQFLRADILAGVLLLPYLAWVSIATLLNNSIWRLNKKPGNPHAEKT